MKVYVFYQVLSVWFALITLYAWIIEDTFQNVALLAILSLLTAIYGCILEAVTEWNRIQARDARRVQRYYTEEMPPGYKEKMKKDFNDSFKKQHKGDWTKEKAG